MEDNFLYTRQVLTKELNKIGGEIFARKVMELQVEMGNEEAKKAINIDKMFSTIILDASKGTEEKLFEIIEAIEILNKYAKEDRQ